MPYFNYARLQTHMIINDVTHRQRNSKTNVVFYEFVHMIGSSSQKSLPIIKQQSSEIWCSWQTENEDVIDLVQKNENDFHQKTDFFEVNCFVNLMRRFNAFRFIIICLRRLIWKHENDLLFQFPLTVTSNRDYIPTNLKFRKTSPRNVSNKTSSLKIVYELSKPLIKKTAESI